jgi:hypothetical protein
MDRSIYTWFNTEDFNKEFSIHTREKLMILSKGIILPVHIVKIRIKKRTL